MSGVLEYVYGLASRVHEYCAEGSANKRKKLKLFTRLDLLLAALLVSVSIFVLMQPQQPAKTSQGAPTVVAQSRLATSSAISNNSGMGGAQASTDSAPCNTPGGPSCPPAQPGGCNQVGGTSCTPTAPANCNTAGGPSCTPTVPTNIPSSCETTATSPDCLKSLGTSASLGANNGQAGVGDDWLTGANGTLFKTDPEQTVANPDVGKLWAATNTVTASFLVLIIIITGYRIMGGAFGFRYAEAIEIFPRIILAFLGAGLSITFVALLIGLENGLCQYIFTHVPNHNYTGIVIPAGKWWDAFWQFILVIAVMILAAILAAIPGVGWVIGAVTSTVGAALFLAALQNLVLTLFSIMLALQFFMRLIMINLYTVLGPWALALSALKEGEGIAKQWFKGLLSLIFIQLLQLVCLSVGLIMFPAHQGNWNDVNITKDLIPFIGPIATIWLTLRLPKVFGISSLGTMMDAGQMASGVVMAGVSGAVGFIGGAQASFAAARQSRQMKGMQQTQGQNKDGKKS